MNRDVIEGLARYVDEIGVSQQHIDTDWARATNAAGALRQAAAALRAQRDRIDALEAGLAEFVRLGKSVSADIQTAHQNRGNGASEWMIEDDRDLRRDFRAALKVAATLTGEKQS